MILGLFLSVVAGPQIASGERAGTNATFKTPVDLEAVEAQAEAWREENPRSSLQDREESSTAFEDLKVGASGDLFDEEFDFLVGDGISGPVVEGTPIEFFGDGAVLLEGEDGSRAIAYSSAPLSTRPDGGTRELVDLTLQDEGSAFVPEHPASESQVFPKSIDKGLPLPLDGGTLRFPAAEEAAGTLIADSEAVLYPEVATDADLVVWPTRLGFQFTLQLRSAESPERIEIPVDLPPDAELREDPEFGGVTIKVSGEPPIPISAPVAMDADRRSVDVGMSVEGSSLVIESGHLDDTVAMPVLIDPTVGDPNTFPNTTDWAIWSNNGNFSNDLNAGSLRVKANQGNYLNGHRAIWYSLVPHYSNTTAYFSRADFENWIFRRGGANLNTASPFAYMGIVRADNGNYLPFPGSHSANADNAGGTAVATNNGTNGYPLVTQGKQARFELYSSSSTTIKPPTGAARYLEVASSKLFVADDLLPETTNTSSTIPTGWVRPTGQTYTVGVQGYDSGLGVKWLDFSALGNYQSKLQKDPSNRDCIGYRESNKCPQTANATFSFSVPSSTATNQYTISARAKDVLQSAPTTWPVMGTLKVDGTNPTSTLSGPLAPGASPRTGNTLSIAASDSHAGVDRVKVYVDDMTNPKANVVYSSPYTFTMSPSQYPGGQYQMKVEVTDKAGNTTTTGPWTAYPDNERPNTTITAKPSSPTNDSTPDFSFTSTKSNSTFQCKVDSEGWSTCTNPYTRSPALTEGSHTFQVRAVDRHEVGS